MKLSEKTTSVEITDTQPVVKHNRGLGGSRSGQTMVEYAILVSMIMLLLFGAVGVFMSGLGSFYLNLVKVVTCPFP